VINDKQTSTTTMYALHVCETEYRMLAVVKPTAMMRVQNYAGIDSRDVNPWPWP